MRLTRLLPLRLSVTWLRALKATVPKVAVIVPWFLTYRSRSVDLQLHGAVIGESGQVRPRYFLDGIWPHASGIFLYPHPLRLSLSN